jgi:putative phage-type endonuclease
MDNLYQAIKRQEKFDPVVPMEERAQYRHTRITGSKIAIIMGVNKYGGSKFRLALEMCGDEPHTLPKSNLLVRVGSYMEDCIKDFILEERQDFKPMPDLGTIEHPTQPLFAASPDWLVEDRYGPAVVEIKNIGPYTAKEWSNGQHPKYYEAQLQWYMGILNDVAKAAGATEPPISHGYLVGLIANRELAVRFILFDAEWYEQAKSAAQDFLAAVEKNEPEEFMWAENEDFADASAILGERSTVESAPIPGSAEQYIYRMERLKGEIKELQKQVEEAKFHLVKSIDGAERAESDKFTVSWPWIGGRKKFDLKAFQRANPDIDLTSYYTESKPYRGGLKITTKED